jgi:hypothetical protein
MSVTPDLARPETSAAENVASPQAVGGYVLRMPTDSCFWAGWIALVRNSAGRVGSSVFTVLSCRDSFDVR